MGQRNPLLVLNIKWPQTSLVYLPQFKKHIWLEENYIEIPDQQLLGTTVRPINQVKRLTKGPESLGLTPHWGPQNLLYKIDKISKESSRTRCKTKACCLSPNGN